MDILRIITGLAFVALGVVIYITSKSLIALLVNIGIGIIILLFAKQEDKIEQRKDIKTKIIKTKKI